MAEDDISKAELLRRISRLEDTAVTKESLQAFSHLMDSKLDGIKNGVDSCKTDIGELSERNKFLARTLIGAMVLLASNVLMLIVGRIAA